MDYQDKNYTPKDSRPMAKEYTDAYAYDKRGESSILERYVLGLWQPFLKNKINKLSDGKIIADLGCGTCEYTQAAKDAKKIYAVDVSEAMLKACREKLEFFNQTEIIQSDIKNFKISESVDLVLAIGIWEYIDSGDLYEKIKNITRQQSKVIVVFPNIYNDLNWMRSIFKMRKVALRPSYIKKLFYSDFTLIESESFGNVCWFPKSLQFLFLPLWKLYDFIWRPFQKFFPLGINVYYLFERK